MPQLLACSVLRQADSRPCSVRKMARVPATAAALAVLFAPLCFVLPGPFRAAPPRQQARSQSGPHQQAPTTPAALCLTLAMGAAFLQKAKSKSKAGKVSKVTRPYTTQTIVPSLTWLKVGLKGSDLQPCELRAYGIAGCDVCVGKTQDGKLFAVGDKAPPTGTSLSVGAEVQGNKIYDGQFGNVFDCFTGQPEGDWCPSPPGVGKFVAWFMGRKEALPTFEVREAFLSGDVEVMVDTNAKAAYESWYWKGLLDAQGKDDGTYY